MLLNVSANFYRKLVFCISLIFLVLPNLGCAYNSASYSPPPSQLNLSVPPGFSIEIYAKLESCESCRVTGPRMLTVDDEGNLYVAMGKLNKVLRINSSHEKNNNKFIETWIDDLNIPNGITYHDGYIYIANEDSVIKVSKKNPYNKQKIIQNLATGWHTAKSIKVGPDNHLYINIGSSCNVCIESDSSRATIQRYTLDGKPEGAIKTYGRHKPDATWARGLRNSQGFDWHPITKKMYATNNGADMRSSKKNGSINDELPPEHFNEILPGEHYGWPYCWGNQFSDPNFEGPQNFCKTTKGPDIMFTSHSTPIGVTFLDKTNFPNKMKNDAVVALHGSWNRKEFSGYKLVLVEFNGNHKPIGYKNFITGWLNNGSAWGRPVDVIQSHDGGLFVSDDRSGYIYKITFESK
jgi:glucose/arabinose dehydrogenase